MREPLVLSGNNLQFVCSVKYLLSEKKIRFSVDHVKVIFFGFLIAYTIEAKVQTLNSRRLNYLSLTVYLVSY